MGVIYHALLPAGQVREADTHETDGGGFHYALSALQLTHQDQMRRLGVRFYIQYLRQYAKYGYNKMPLEIEARQSEK